MSQNLVRCSRCKSSIISEEFDTHCCAPRIKGFREIEIDFSWQHKSQDGRNLINARGLDGIIYTLVEAKERKPLEYLPAPSPEVKRSDKSPEDEPEPKLGKKLKNGLEIPKDQPEEILESSTRLRTLRMLYSTSFNQHHGDLTKHELKITQMKEVTFVV